MPLDINLFRKEKGGDPDKIRKSCEARFQDPKIVDEVIALDDEWRKLTFQIDELNKNLNKMSKEFGKRMKAKEPVDDLKNQIAADKETLKEVKGKIAEAEKAVNRKLGSIGNIVHDDVHVSKNEEESPIAASFNVESIRKAKDGEKLYHHHELLYMIGGYAPEQGTKVAGHRGYYLTNVGVLLNQALINFGLSYLMKHNYSPIQPPFFMDKEIMAETAQLEEFDEALYKVQGEGIDDEKYLIATSEQPLSAYHRKEWIQASELPIKYAGISSCFRKEAGSHGKDAWGIFRVHQFEKVEQFLITEPSKSWEAHEEMLKISEGFYQALNLPYKVINIVSGELNNAAAKKLDLEAWFPTLGEWRELVSCSNCTDYQARAMETRFGTKNAKDKEKQYVHMLNGTLCATSRTICCILENYQTEEGVVVPEVLRPFMGGMEIMPFVKPCPENVNAKKIARAAEKKKQHNKKNKA